PRLRRDAPVRARDRARARGARARGEGRQRNVPGRRAHESLDLLREDRTPRRGRGGTRSAHDTTPSTGRGGDDARVPPRAGIPPDPASPPRLPHSAAAALPQALPQLDGEPEVRTPEVMRMNQRRTLQGLCAIALMGAIGLVAAPRGFGGGGDDGVDILPGGG